MKTQLISYGGEKYKTEKELLKETALSSSFFDKVTLYGPECLDPAFYAQFKVLLNQQKGAGYWVWKPYLLKKVLNTLPENDILVYADAGSMINSRGRERFHDYLTILKDTSTGSLAFELEQKEVESTKQEVFDEFIGSTALSSTKQLTASIILLKKCPQAVRLVDKWYQTLCKKPLLFTNDKTSAIQHSGFIRHYHDQSVFSIIRKLDGSEIIANETLFSDYIREGHAYPFWATPLG